MIKRLLLVFVCLLVSLPAAAMDTGDFAALPVQHDGRIKPIDSFARTNLRIFSGSDRLPGMSADEWLAEILFNPAAAAERPVFRLLRPADLSLPMRKGRLYSFAEIAGSLKARAEIISALAQKDEKTWSDDQRALIELYDKSVVYTQLLRSFSAILPLAVSVPESLRKAWKIPEDMAPRTAEEFMPYQERLKKALDKIVRAKGEDIEKYTDAEKEIALLAWQLQVLQESGANNILLRIVPPQDAALEWLSPWMVTHRGGDTEYLAHWKTMALAWQNGDDAAWNKAGQDARAAMKDYMGVRLTLERIYNAVHPMGVAMLLYLFGFLGVIVASFRRRDLMLRVAAWTIGAGAALQATAIMARIVILSRPPVGTLYESVLFVSLICVIAALLAERKLRDGTGLSIAAIAGGGLLFTAGAFTPDDSLQVLIAVLNTSFWLTTHVLCITIGYGWCVVAGILAHLYLFNEIRSKAEGGLERIVKTTALTALLFTTVGTILGGIWADQSWGRFWGWDPKENGALLIVLWLIWLLHGRIALQITRRTFMAGIAALTMVVALSWFGVNLLSTGLHSYGFIEGVAGGLFAFCAAEAALIAALWYKAKQGKGFAS